MNNWVLTSAIGLSVVGGCLLALLTLAIVARVRLLRQDHDESLPLAPAQGPGIAE